MKKFTDINEILEKKGDWDDENFREEYVEDEPKDRPKGTEKEWWSDQPMSEWEFFKRKKDEEESAEQEEIAKRLAEEERLKKEELLRKRQERAELKRKAEEERKKKEEEERLRRIEEEKKKRKTFQVGDTIVMIKNSQGKLPLEAWEFLRTYKRFKVLSVNNNGKINIGCRVTRDGVSKLYMFSTKRFELESVVKSGGYKPPVDDEED